MSKWISRIVGVLLIVLLIGVFTFIYNKYYFNDFAKAHRLIGMTSFYKEKNSYCIDSNEYNDALFFKEISVEKNTPYKITCKIKTEDVVSDKPSTAGACISLMDKVEQSTPVQGTTDWQEVSLLVDSKDDDSLKISFRLGGYDGYSKGKAYFSDIRVEKGSKDPSKDWNVVCFLINNVDFNLNGTRHKYSLTTEDKRLLRENMSRFATTCREFSEEKMTVTYKVIEIDEPLTSFSYDNDNYYYATPDDVHDLIDDYVKENEYDHIFIGLRMGNTVSEIPVNEWIGLGSMRYGSIGFSNIRMPNDLQHSTMYKYDIRNDIFPEEVFVHEFLHSLERNLLERGYVFPALHDNEKFGYKSQVKTGLRDWYKKYMRCDIDSDVGKTGLDESVYTMKPIQFSDFQYSEEVEFEVIPHNFIDVIMQFIDNFKKILVENNTTDEMEQTNYVTVTTD